MVFGAGRRQEYISPPTGATPHVRGLPSGDIGYGMQFAVCFTLLCLVYDKSGVYAMAIMYVTIE